MSPSAKDSVPDAVREGEPISETALLRNPRWAEGRSEADKKKTNKKRARTKRREKGGSSPPFSLPRSPSVSAPACWQAGLPVGRSAGAASPLIPVRRFPGGRISSLAGSVARGFALAFSAALRLLVSRFAVHLGVDHAIQILEHKARVYPERLPAVRTRDPEFQLFVGHRS